MRHVNNAAPVLVPNVQKSINIKHLHITRVPNWFQSGKGNQRHSVEKPKQQSCSLQEVPDTTRGQFLHPCDLKMYILLKFLLWEMQDQNQQELCFIFPPPFPPPAPPIKFSFFHGKTLLSNLEGFRTGKAGRNRTYSSKKPPNKQQQQPKTCSKQTYIRHQRTTTFQFILETVV